MPPKQNGAQQNGVDSGDDEFHPAEAAVMEGQNIIKPLRASLRANKGHLTRRKAVMATLIAQMNQNATRPCLLKLVDTQLAWEKKAFKIEEILHDLLEVDAARAAEYEQGLHELGKDMEEVAGMVAEAAALCPDDRPIQVATDGHNGMRVRSDLKPKDLSSEVTPVEYTAWKEDFRTYFEASRLDRGTAREQQQCLLGFLDTELREAITQNVERTRAVFQHQLLDAHGRERTDLQSCIRILDDHFVSKCPVNMRRLEFSKAQQAKGQTLSQFATSLRGQWLECDFNNFNAHEWLMTILANGCRSTRQKEKIREMKNQTWKQVKDTIRQWEADNNEDKVSDQKMQVQQVQQVQKGSKSKGNGNGKRTLPRPDADGKCWKCFSTEHRSQDCTWPADMKCNKCGKPGHKGIACFSKKNNKSQQDKTKKTKVRQVEEKAADEEQSDSEECRAVSSSKEVLFS